jgi:hypothetical protein
MKTTLIFLFLIFGVTVFAGQSGFIKNGKAFVMFRNGEKTADFDKIAAEHFTKGRKPSSKMQAGHGDVLMFEEDEFARCYGWGKYSSPNYVMSPTSSIDCIKKDNIK